MLLEHYLQSLFNSVKMPKAVNKPHIHCSAVIILCLYLGCLIFVTLYFYLKVVSINVIRMYLTYSF